MKFLLYAIHLFISAIIIPAAPTGSNREQDPAPYPHIIDRSQCYICHEEDGTFPFGGPCNIDDIIEDCRHQPPCRNNRNWRCGHVFCRDCIIDWKQSWTNNQLQALFHRPIAGNSIRFYCPRCFREKGCPIDLEHNLGQINNIRLRHGAVMNDLHQNLADDQGNLENFILLATLCSPMLCSALLFFLILYFE